MVNRRNIAEISRKAYGAMTASFKPVPRDLIASFRLWRFPAAGPHVSWTVFHPRDHDPGAPAPRVRRLTWDRDADLDRLDAGTLLKPRLEPTLARLEVDVEAPTLSRFMKEAGRLAIPRDRLTRPYLTDQPPEFGLEGFDLEGHDGRPIVRMEWDAPASLQLEAVSAWTDQVRAWLLKTIP